MRPLIASQATTGWWSSTTSTLGDWWQWILDHGETAGKVLLTVVVAIVLWIIGRLLIRAATKGIRDGISRSERRTRKLLLKANLPVPERTLEDQLEETRRVQRAQTIGTVLRSVLTMAIVATAAISILGIYQVNVGGVIAAAGIVGVALGFGAQSLVKDLLSGMFMLVEDQYGVGDVIDVGPATGLVEHVGLRSTRLRSLDGTVWFVPNGEIQRVGNMSQLYSRAKIEVRFAFDVDVDAARQAMLDAAEMAREDEAVAESIIGDPEVAGIEALDYNSVTLRLLLQTKPITQWGVMRAIRQNMRDLFLERGIALAAPEGALLQPGANLAASTADANTKPPAASKARLDSSSSKRPSSRPKKS
jgi:small conductance mechanosensitive channel